MRVTELSCRWQHGLAQSDRSALGNGISRKYRECPQRFNSFVYVSFGFSFSHLQSITYIYFHALKCRHSYVNYGYIYYIYIYIYIWEIINVKEYERIFFRFIFHLWKVNSRWIDMNSIFTSFKTFPYKNGDLIPNLIWYYKKELLLHKSKF